MPHLTRGFLPSAAADLATDGIRVQQSPLCSCLASAC